LFAHWGRHERVVLNVILISAGGRTNIATRGRIDVGPQHFESPGYQLPHQSIADSFVTLAFANAFHPPMSPLLKMMASGSFGMCRQDLGSPSRYRGDKPAVIKKVEYVSFMLAPAIM
jgi:hypothetical protein